MKLRRSKKPPQPTQAHRLEQQVNEILSLIISKIRCQSIQDVASLSLVSRQFYILAVPHLYRKITLDLDRASHLRLLQRLERPGSHVPHMIRHLHVCLEGKHAEHMPRIEKVFAGLTNLVELEWEGPFNVPVHLLDALYSRFPRARFFIESSRVAYKSSETGISPLWGMDLWTKHPAASMITHLRITLDEKSAIWPGFKRGLVRTIIRDPVLESLQLEANEVIDNHSNSTVDLMKGHVLPKLRVLGLFVGNSPIFTQDELLFWGDQAGWESLKFLGLYHTQSLIPFVGRTPNLEELWLLPLEGEDTTGLKSHLAGFKDSYPFPALRQLKARPPWRDIALSQQNDRVIPWYLINRLSPEHLTCLDISRSSHRDQDVTDVPQAEDIARIRGICPNLQDLRLDMIIPWSHEPFPRDIAKELTAFTKPISLTIYLHVTRHPHLGTEALYLWIARGLRWCFRSSFKIARCFLKERESQRIHGQPRFSVNIIWANDVFAENDSIRSAHFHICTVETHQDVSRSHNEILFKHATSNKDIEKMSLDQLKDRTKPRLGNIVGGRARYLREIRRRENLNDVGTGAYEIDATLYDILTASDPV